MSFFQNDTFGYNMQLAAAASSQGSGFGAGFGSSGSGFGGRRQSFGTSTMNNGFGNVNINDPNSIYIEAQANPEYMQRLAQRGLYVRQNSLMSEMTQTKKERGRSPWAMSQLSGSYANAGPTHNGVVSMSIFDKPEDLDKRPKLQRQHTFSMADSTERKRAPSFASDPDKMRGRTISSSSAPARSSIRKLSRSISINEDLTTPANMDIAGPMIRRQQSLDAEKAEKAKRRPFHRKNSLLSSLHFSRKRKSSKSTSDESGMVSEASETYSIQASVRTRSNTLDSRSSLADSVLTRDTAHADKDRSSPTANRDDHEKLILSLMNHPPSPDTGSPGEDSPFPPVPAYYHEPSPSSPTEVSKKVHEHQKLDRDETESDKSPETRPALRNEPAPSSPKVYQGRAALLLPNQITKAADRSDSDVSEVYFDCNQSKQNSPQNNQTDTGSMSKSKKRSSRRHRPEAVAVQANWTDGEDTTSTCDTPPRKQDTETDSSSKIRDKGLIPGETPPNLGQPTPSTSSPRKRPSLPLPGHSFSQTVKAPPEPEEMGEPPLIKPVYSNTTHMEPDLREIHELENADSSESGYATSHKPLSPKDYHLKVTQFVNSLPSNPDVNERLSENEQGALNGSITETDSENEHSADIHFYPQKALTDVICESGSESDQDLCHSEGHVSTENLEVMKLLESPKDVSARILGSLERPSRQEEPEDTGPPPSYMHRKDSQTSQTEILKLGTSEQGKTDNAESPSKKEKHVELKSEIRPEEMQEDHMHDHKMTRRPRRPSRQISNVSTMFSLGRQFSSVYSSETTNCIDMILHLLNFLLFLSSATVIGVGLWLLLKDFGINDVTMILDNNLLQVIVYVAIAGAGVTILAAFCLCCGARQDKIGLGFYAIVLVTVVITFATCAVLATIFSDKLHGIEFRVNFKDRLETMYGTDENVDSRLLTKAWDTMQAEFECCGGDGNENSTDSWALYRKSLWFIHHPDKALVFVPESCCKKNSNIMICQGGDHDLMGPPRYLPPINKYYPQRNPNLNTNGCYTFFHSYLNGLSKIIAQSMGILAGLYLLTVMLTWVFCFRKQKDYRDFDYFDDSYDYEDQDDVYNEHAPNQKSPREEETAFMSNRSPNYHDSRHTKRYLTNETSSAPTPKNYRDFSRPVDGFEDEESDSDDASSQSSHSSSHEEVIARRNMWLTSNCSGHLLSMAIEEEDSNFEDSDDDNDKQNRVAYV